jgi:hypothetical protein
VSTTNVISNPNEDEVKKVRVLDHAERIAFESDPTNVIVRARPGKVRCPYTDCGKCFNYAIKAKGWLQQEGEDINSKRAVKITAYRCRACDREFNDLTKRGTLPAGTIGLKGVPPAGTPESKKYWREFYGLDKPESVK